VIDAWLSTGLDTYSTVCYPHYCLFTYSCHFLFSLYYYHMFTFICMCIFPVYSHTFTGSSDSLNLHIQICGYLLLIRYLERITCVTRSWSPSLLDYRYSCSFIHVISWFYLCRVSCNFFPLFICYHCLDIYIVILQWYWFIVVDFIACSGFFRLSVYTWGILLVYTSPTFVATPFPRILGSRAWHIWKWIIKYANSI